MAAGAGTETGSSSHRIKGQQERIGLIDVDGHNYPNLPLIYKRGSQANGGMGVQVCNDCLYMG